MITADDTFFFHLCHLVSYHFVFASKSYGKKSIIGIRARDKKGVMSAILTVLYEAGANVISINSAMPVKGVAFVTLAIDVSDAKLDTTEVVAALKKIDHVKSANIIAIE